MPSSNEPSQILKNVPCFSILQSRGGRGVRLIFLIFKTYGRSEMKKYASDFQKSNDMTLISRLQRTKHLHVMGEETKPTHFPKSTILISY